MQKINFVNNSQPYLSAENLNQLQTNIENAIDNYSTTETVIGKWIDNKPIYRKVIELTTASGDNFINLSDISNNIGYFVKLSGTTMQSSGNIAVIPYYSTSTDFTVIYYRNASTAINVKCGTVGGFGNAKIILEYTKTTD